MAHPHNEHRAHKKEHSRVAHITRGYAAGGAVHSDEAEDRAMVKKMVKPGALKVDGHKAKHRADRPGRARGGKVKRDDGGSVGKREVSQQEQEAAPYNPDPMGLNQPYKRAKGGRTNKKGGKTVVNVISGGGHPAPMPMAAAGPPPMPAAAPPMPPRPMPGPMMPPGGAPGMPPGMPPRRAGGRAYAKGGRVADGPAYREGIKNGTQVTHSPGKNDQAGLNRGRQITYATGGKVESPQGVAKATMLPGGSGGGEARLAKEKRAARDYKRA